MIDNEYSPILHYFYSLMLFAVLEFILQKKKRNLYATFKKMCNWKNRLRCEQKTLIFWGNYLPFKQWHVTINLLKNRNYLKDHVSISRFFRLNTRYKKSSLVKCSKGQRVEQITDQELESRGFKPLTLTKVLGVLTQDDTWGFIHKRVGCKSAVSFTFDHSRMNNIIVLSIFRKWF